MYNGSDFSIESTEVHRAEMERQAEKQRLANLFKRNKRGNKKNGPR